MSIMINLVRKSLTIENRRLDSPYEIQLLFDDKLVHLQSRGKLIENGKFRIKKLKLVKGRESDEYRLMSDGLDLVFSISVNSGACEQIRDRLSLPAEVEEIQRRKRGRSSLEPVNKLMDIGDDYSAKRVSESTQKEHSKENYPPEPAKSRETSFNGPHSAVAVKTNQRNSKEKRLSDGALEISTKAKRVNTGRNSSAADTFNEFQGRPPLAQLPSEPTKQIRSCDPSDPSFTVSINYVLFLVCI